MMQSQLEAKEGLVIHNTSYVYIIAESEDAGGSTYENVHVGAGLWASTVLGFAGPQSEIVSCVSGCSFVCAG